MEKTYTEQMIEINRLLNKCDKIYSEVMPKLNERMKKLDEAIENLKEVMKYEVRDF